MGKPYMPLMMGDWIRGTRGMRAEVKGVYIGLLIHQYDSGFLPADLDELSLIEPEVGKVWVKLKDKFLEVEPGKLKNQKLEEVRDFWNKQVNNGKKGGRPKKGNPDINPKPNPKNNHHIDLDIDYNFKLEFAKIFNKPYPKERGIQNEGQHVDTILANIPKMHKDEILKQARAMKEVYKFKNLYLPTNPITIMESFSSTDWVQRLREQDPENISNGKRREPEPDTIGTSKPGSLD